MRLLACLAGCIALSAPASALTLVARAPAPRGPALDAKIRQSAAIACQALAGCEDPIYLADGPAAAAGRVFFKGSGFRSELTQAQRDALLARLQALWGEPVAVSEDLPALSRRDRALESRVSKALPGMLPKGLLDGSADGAFYDRAAPGSGVLGAPAEQTWGAASGRLAWPGLAPSTPPTAGPAPAPPAVEAGDAKPGPYAREIAAAARRYQLDPRVLTAVVAAKSGFRARGGGGDAYGLMGLSRRSFRVLEGRGKDIYEPEANLDAGARILSGLLKQFGGDINRALAAYQAGPRAVLRSGGIPNSRSVRVFLADYQRALRSGPDKPAVVPVPPPSPLRRLRDQAQEAAVAALDRTEPPAGGRLARYRSLIESAAKRAGVDPLLMEAMVMRESDGDPRARSRKGALGLGQLMPETARELGVKNPRDPAQNLRGMASHLDYLLGKYANPVIAVAAYNAGEGRVDRAGWRVPYLRETRAYVKKVFQSYFELTGRRYDVESLFAPAPPRGRRRRASIRRRTRPVRRR